MLAAIGIVSFGAISLWLWELLRHKPDTVRRRMLAGEYRAAERDRRLEGNFLHRLVRPGLVRFGSTLAKLLPHNLVRSVDQKLIMANEPMPLSLFLLFWAGFVALGAALLAVLASSLDVSATQMIGPGVAALFLPAMIPYLVLRRRVLNRQKAIVRALPDSLDLLTTTVEAGLGIDSAFAYVAEKTHGPLAESIVRYLRETGMGRPRRESLLNVAERTGVLDFVRLAAAVAQAEETGTNLGDVLRIQSEELRVTRRQRAQEAAQKAPVKMTIPLALCFLPAMVAVIVVPPVINLVRFVGDLRP